MHNHTLPMYCYPFAFQKLSHNTDVCGKVFLAVREICASAKLKRGKYLFTRFTVTYSKQQEDQIDLPFIHFIYLRMFFFFFYHLI